MLEKQETYWLHGLCGCQPSLTLFTRGMNVLSLTHYTTLTLLYCSSSGVHLLLTAAFKIRIAVGGGGGC